MSKRTFLKAICAVVLLSAAASGQDKPLDKYEFSVLSDMTFDGPARAGVIQGFDGYLYGAAFDIFKLYPAPFSLDTSLYFFCSQPGCSDGSGPASSLIQASDGNFYGTTASGGTQACIVGCGTVFQITPDGAFTTLYRFSGPDGSAPDAGVIQAGDGDFYGTTSGGGTNGGGTIFKITSAGTLTVLYNFCAKSKCTDGANPLGELVQANNGIFYGTTSSGGIANKGTVFRISSAGKVNTLHRFSGSDGAAPFAGVVQAKDGKFYGTTSAGGAYGLGAIFRISSAGKFSTLYSFCAAGFPSCPDGDTPYGGLVESTKGVFFGTTYEAGLTHQGTIGAGTVFEYVPSSGLTTVYAFCSSGGCADGANPFAGLTEGTDGALYGTTLYGFDTGPGVVFAIFSADSPFVETNPTAGKVGTAVTILGNNLTSATKVAFGSTVATFSVVSPSEIVATVPVGARTGKVHVTIPGGKLLSKVPFRVTQ